MDQYKKFIYFLIILVFFISINFNIFSQKIGDLEKRKKENVEAIQLATELLKETAQKKSKTLNDLYLIESKILNREELISKISIEISYYNNLLDNIHIKISQLEKDLNILKENYAKIIRHSYKFRSRPVVIMFILSSANFNQGYKRIKYLQQLFRYQNEQKQQIIFTKNLLVDESIKIDNIINYKNKLLIEKSNEFTALNNEKKNQNSLLNSLKSQESSLRTELNNRKETLKKLENAIKEFIKNEANKVEDNKLIYALTPDEKILSDNFEKNRGLLPWPTERGIITGKYGEQKHPLFKYVTIKNSGIDITSPVESNVRSIYSGEVKNIITVPGLHKAVIVRHGEYLTVYSNLSSVYVNVGDKIDVKQNIGKIYYKTGDKNSILHFELWHENSNLNPNDWIKKN